MSCLGYTLPSAVHSSPSPSVVPHAHSPVQYGSSECSFDDITKAAREITARVDVIMFVAGAASASIILSVVHGGGVDGGNDGGINGGVDGSVNGGKMMVSCIGELQSLETPLTLHMPE